MGKKIERVFRDRQLTPEEVARDEEIRRRVMDEFPPAKRIGPSGAFSVMLRQALRTSGRSVGEIAAAAGISESVVSRFLAGEGDIHMATADKLAEVLGLKLAAAT